MPRSITLYSSNIYTQIIIERLDSAGVRIRSSLRLLCLILSVLLLTSACSAANEPSSKIETTPVKSDKTETIYQQVDEISNDKYCEASSDCAFLAMGQRACGGPSSYQLYSKQIGDEAVKKLKVLSAKSTELAQQAIQRGGMLGTCQIDPIPSASCVENQCRQNTSPNPTY